MGNCVICGNESGSECCSGKCRAAKSRRTRERTERTRTVEAHAAQGIITDACGNVHQIDYEGRRKNRALLESWSKGKGTPGQQAIGRLSRQYEVIKGVDVDVYLGKVA